MKTIYAGTNGERAKEIIPWGSLLPGGDNLFGGIFGSEDKEIAASHGDIIQTIVSHDHISHDDFQHEIFYSEQSDSFISVLNDIIDTELTYDELAELLDYVAGAKSLFYDESDMGTDRLSEILDYALTDPQDCALADWHLQGIKGELARRHGYTSVGMPDEHGESVLALAGSRVVL